MIVVDTDVIAAAGERYLVAGMGDAMATWYEADTCLHNPMARNSLGALPTLASVAIGEICARTLFEFEKPQQNQCVPSKIAWRSIKLSKQTPCSADWALRAVDSR